MVHPEAYHPPQPVIRRGIQLDILTDFALISAQNYRDRYRLDRALGLKTDLDKEGVELFVASRRAKLQIREMRRSAQEPAQVESRQIVERQIEELIASYRADYHGDVRPDLIQRGVNQMLTQAEAQGLHWWQPWRTRRIYRDLGAEWKDLIKAQE